VEEQMDDGREMFGCLPNFEEAGVNLEKMYEKMLEYDITYTY
jgi:hypothetical protein